MAWGDYDNGGRTSTSAWRRIKQQAKHALPYQCAKCGTGEPLELDHIVNHKRGGTDALDNLQWLCPPCHKAKTQQEAAARRGQYRRKPKPPLGK